MVEESQMRRTILQIGGVFGAVALAGCSGLVDSDGDDETQGDEGTESNQQDSDTAEEEPSGDTAGGDQQDGEAGGDDTENGESTGEESTSQVADTINVLSQVGSVNADGDAITLARLAVQRSAGSGDIDLSELSIQYVGDNDFAQFAHASQTDGSAYYLETIAAETEDEMITDDADRYQLSIPFGSAAEDEDLASVDPVAGNGNVSNELNPLAAGEEAEIEITLANGAARQTEIVVPDTLENQDSVTL